jgi:predicted PurR-regulated permease PerM
VYLATTFTFLISIVPIIPPYLVCLPWVTSIWVTSSFIKAIALFGVQYFAFTLVDDMLYEKSIVALNSYVSALSVVFGVYVFGFEVCIEPIGFPGCFS